MMIAGAALSIFVPVVWIMAYEIAVAIGNWRLSFVSKSVLELVTPQLRR
jgi:hypothetical protein